jgi:hypothetical protein
MSLFTAGIDGPISLSSGRVVTAEDGPFEYEVKTPHDEDLVERGVLIEAALPAPAAPATPTPAAPESTTTPAAGATPKAGE